MQLGRTVLALTCMHFSPVLLLCAPRASHATKTTHNVVQVPVAISAVPAPNCQKEQSHARLEDK